MIDRRGSQRLTPGVHGITVALLRGVAVELVRNELPLAETPRVTLEDRVTEQPENMKEQAERPQNLKGACRGVDKCGPEWPAHGPETPIDRRLESSNSLLLQRFSRVERVTGIEPHCQLGNQLDLANPLCPAGCSREARTPRESAASRE
jgi:hypothetical protein